MTRRNSLLLLEHDQARRLRLGTAIVRRKWRLRAARTEAEAIEISRWFDASVIVVGLDLVRAHDDDLVARLREVTSATIIGMLDRDRDAESLGVDAVLVRPFSVDALFEAIDYGRRRRAATDEPVTAIE